jgi:cellulose synthase (UDP-forming)
MRTLITCGIISVLLFLYWFLRPAHIGNTFLFWLLTFALAFKVAKMCQEWYYYWSPSVTPRPACKKQFTVDVLTTFCPGEPKDMIVRTLKAMQAIRYPHVSYLCDEADDPELKEICSELGVVHVTRTLKINAKAGNINNALQQATGELCLVLDPDHEPLPEFLDRVVPYFENDEIGFVQCVQAYGNQEESFIALGAAQQTYHFYGPMMMTMNTYGTAQAIGANCTFRRKALDSIGGHAAGLAEDMHTAMQLHAKGWKSVYVPEILSRGLVPATLSSYYKQQLKWSRGVFELLFRVYPKIWRNFTWRQKLHYFALPHYFLYGLVNLIDICVPLLALVTAQVPWELDMVRFGVYFLPLCALSLTIRTFAQRWLLEKHERGLHLAGGVLRTATWWIFLLGFLYSLFKIKVPYIPTPKEDEHENCLGLCVPNMVVIFVSLAGIAYGLYLDWTPFSLAMAFYSFIVAAILGIGVVVSQQKFVRSVKNALAPLAPVRLVSALAARAFVRCEQLTYQLLHNGMVVLIIAVSALFLSYSTLDEIPGPADAAEKELGGFYIGVEQQQLPVLEKIEKGFGQQVNVVKLELAWGDSTPLARTNQLNTVSSLCGIPYLTWNIDGIAADSLHEDITGGHYDAYLKYCAAQFREHRGPVFISFPCSEGTATRFIAAWQYLYTFFNNLGISNLTWVWAPSSPTHDHYYPGEKFVDWLGVRILNYGNDKLDGDWYSFSQLYKPYRSRFGKFQKPVLLTAFGCQQGIAQAGWFEDALKAMQAEFTEISGAILYSGKERMQLSSHEFYTRERARVAPAARRPAEAGALLPQRFACSFQHLPLAVRQRQARQIFIAGERQALLHTRCCLQYGARLARRLHAAHTPPARARFRHDPGNGRQYHPTL